MEGLLQQQYRRAEAFTAWAALFRAMLEGSVKAADYDGLASSTVYPQIQAVNDVFRAVIAAGGGAAAWAGQMQNAERRRFDITVQFQQAVIDHLSGAVGPRCCHGHGHGHGEEASAHLHTTACPFFASGAADTADESLTDRLRAAKSHRSLPLAAVPVGGLYRGGMSFAPPVADGCASSSDSDAEEAVNGAALRAATTRCAAVAATLRRLHADITEAEENIRDLVSEAQEEVTG